MVEIRSWRLGVGNRVGEEGRKTLRENDRRTRRTEEMSGEGKYLIQVDKKNKKEVEVEKCGCSRNGGKEARKNNKGLLLYY